MDMKGIGRRGPSSAGQGQGEARAENVVVKTMTLVVKQCSL